MLKDYIDHLSQFKQTVMHRKTFDIINFFISLFSTNCFYGLEIKYLLDSNDGPRTVVLKKIYFTEQEAKNRLDKEVKLFSERFDKAYKDGKLLFSLKEILKVNIIPFEFHDSYYK